MRLLRLQHLHRQRVGQPARREPASYVDAAISELDLAVRVLGPDAPPVSTIFVGGGTPTLLPPDDLGRLVAAIRSRFGLTADAEVTTESNPESIDAAGLVRLRELGFTRISFGMQSAVPYVLTVLDRVHTPGRPEQAVREARAAGFTDISLDLIYGTPGESLADWATSLDSALAAQPDHISAYALIVEDGTRLAARIRRGELPMTDDDDLADKYLLAEERLSAAGLSCVRGQQLVHRPGHPVPAQPGLLAQRPLVGHRARCPQPRRRGAVVERQAPGRVRRPDRRAGFPGVRPRGARRRGSAGGAGAAGASAGRGSGHRLY